jgi:hypothetical protein
VAVAAPVEAAAARGAGDAQSIPIAANAGMHLFIPHEGTKKKLRHEDPPTSFVASFFFVPSCAKIRVDPGSRPG